MRKCERRKGGNARDIYIGHLDEMHYISTTHISQTVSEHPATVANSVKADKIIPNKSVINNSKSRKEYMKEYMKKKRIMNLKPKKMKRKKYMIENTDNRILKL